MWLPLPYLDCAAFHLDQRKVAILGHLLCHLDDSGDRHDSNVAPLLSWRRLVKLSLEGLGPLSLQMWEKEEGLQSWLRCTILCLQVKKFPKNVREKYLLPFFLQPSFIKEKYRNFHPPKNTIVSILESLFSPPPPL